MLSADGPDSQGPACEPRSMSLAGTHLPGACWCLDAPGRTSTVLCSMQRLAVPPERLSAGFDLLQVSTAPQWLLCCCPPLLCWQTCLTWKGHLVPFILCPSWEAALPGKLSAEFLPNSLAAGKLLFCDSRHLFLLEQDRLAHLP